MSGNLVSYSKGRTEMRMLENKVLRRIFGHKREEITGE
jgi:hypothetical protein